MDLLFIFEICDSKYNPKNSEVAFTVIKYRI